jgi:hypothetical protein
VSQETTNHSFDDLARAVAEGSLSRRGALKLIAGTAIAALIPSRALAGEDDCVRICHVPFDRETEECEFAKAETRCLSRRERRRHLENHPCDCRGRCANCLTPPAEPICNPPCPEDHKCVQAEGGPQTFCQAICDPPCPGDCGCLDRADGPGNACIACGVGCPVAPNNDCLQCPTGTICVLFPLVEEPFCCQPAAPAA